MYLRKDYKLVREGRLADGATVSLEYETGKASMAPIYYFRYWKIKYPVLDMLRA